MARNYYNQARRVYGSARGAYRRTRSYARRRYNNAYARAYTGFYNSRVGYGSWKANQSIGLYNPGTEFAAGVAVGGLTNIDDQIPFYVKVGLACAPLRGGIGGKISRFMKGMVLGDILQAKLNLPNLTGGFLPNNNANRVLPGAI